MVLNKTSMLFPPFKRVIYTCVDDTEKHLVNKKWQIQNDLLMEKRNIVFFHLIFTILHKIKWNLLLKRINQKHFYLTS